MNLGAEVRFNTPGRVSGNWTWRYSSIQFDKLRRDNSDYLNELAELYDRGNG
jgi:4-alpha-glucanotransferase